MINQDGPINLAFYVMRERQRYRYWRRVAIALAYLILK